MLVMCPILLCIAVVMPSVYTLPFWICYIGFRLVGHRALVHETVVRTLV